MAGQRLNAGFVASWYAFIFPRQAGWKPGKDEAQSAGKGASIQVNFRS